jgi:nucleotide-binding universal stress UspA family protein
VLGFEVHSQAGEDGPWTLHVRGRVERASNAESTGIGEPIAAIQARCVPFSAREHYAAFDARAGRGGHGDIPGADIATYLARHGVKANVSATNARDMDIGSQILSRADDDGADLIVMGGYGHSRAFEFIMGGTTRTLLASMTIPVLFAH